MSMSGNQDSSDIDELGPLFAIWIRLFQETKPYGFFMQFLFRLICKILFSVICYQNVKLPVKAVGVCVQLFILTIR